MIIKKPYGFLIKHFKLLHLLLLVPMVYVMLKFGDISTFYKDFVRAEFRTYETNVAGTYITAMTFASLLLLVLSNAIIMVLLKLKKKNVTFYLINVVYYIILIVMAALNYGIMADIDIGTTMKASAINVLRDIAGMIVLPSYPLILFQIITGIGFNIKTFRFDKKIDINIDEEDEEEVEIKLGEGYTLKRNIVHTLRELKYYVLENKFIFMCIGGVLIIGTIIGLYINTQIYNKKYKIYQSFALDTFTMTLKESYLTDIDYKGEKIAKGTYYLAVKISIYNKSSEAATIDKANFRIFLDDKVLYPNYERSSRFIDIGKNYQGNSIFGGTADDYVLVYELDSSMLRNQYQMKILSDLKHEPNKLVPSYKIINIKPTNILKEEQVGEGKIGTEFKMNETLLGKTTYKLENVTFDRKYQYSYKQCSSPRNCKTLTNTIIPKTPNKVLMIIDDDITWDETASYFKNSRLDLYGDFGSIIYDYTYNGKESEFKSNLVDITPPNIKDVKIYEVSNTVLSGKDKTLRLKIRNKYITIHL